MLCDLEINAMSIFHTCFLLLFYCLMGIRIWPCNDCWLKFRLTFLVIPPQPFVSELLHMNDEGLYILLMEARVVTFVIVLTSFILGYI